MHHDSSGLSLCCYESGVLILDISLLKSNLVILTSLKNKLVLVRLDLIFPLSLGCTCEICWVVNRGSSDYEYPWWSLFICFSLFWIIIEFSLICSYSLDESFDIMYLVSYFLLSVFPVFPVLLFSLWFL